MTDLIARLEQVERDMERLERHVAYLMETDGAVAAWLFFRNLADIAYRDVRKIQEDHGFDHEGVEAFMDRHRPPEDDS